MRSNRRTSNRKFARPLRGPAMDTKFGVDIDPDEIRGHAGRDIDLAMDKYEVFHKKRPLRVVELDADLPRMVVPVGQAISTMYRTDKWKPDGKDEDYKHVHDPEDDGPREEYRLGEGVFLYEPASEAKRSLFDGEKLPTARAQRLPRRPYKAWALLGYCLGLFVQRLDNETHYSTHPRGTYLFASPDGRMLMLFSPDLQPDGSSGVLAVLAGANLDVIDDGIVG